MRQLLFKQLLIIMLFAMPFFALNGKAQTPANCEDVIYQAFYWDSFTDSKWTTLDTQVDELSANFDLIWLPVSCKSSWMGYMPQWWFDQNSAFGSDVELKKLIADLKAKGTGCIADVVVNHRDYMPNTSLFPTETYKGVSYPLAKNAIVKNEGGTGANDTGIDFGGTGVPDLDHTSVAVQNTIKAFLDFLKTEMGYVGWRYDMVKGFHGWHVGQYNDASSPIYSVGECWGTNDEIKAWIKDTEYKSTAFDFGGKYAINEAFATNDFSKLSWGGQPAGLIADPAFRRYATTFVDNHDTGRTTPPDDHSDFVGNVAAANAFILSSPGVPSIWMTHWKANKTKISEMIAARKLVRLHSQSTSTVISAVSNLYVAETFGLNGSLIVKIGSGNYNAPLGYTLATWGTDYAIWTKQTNPTTPKVNVIPAGGVYIGGTSVVLSSSNGATPVKIYYTTDGKTPTASSTLYSTPIEITNDNTVLTAIAIDNNNISSPVVANTYFTTQPPGITVSFTAPVNWAKVGCYVWTGTSTTLAGAWPGTEITSSAIAGTYSFTITNTAILPINIVFNNLGSYEQTLDLSTSTNTCWLAGTGTGASTQASPKKYTANISQCMVSMESRSATNQLSIFPNPANDTFMLESDLDISMVQIYSISGVLIHTEVLLGKSKQIDIANLESGYYNVVALSDTQIITSKLIKK